MEPRSVSNRLSVGGSMTGPVIQSGGSVRINGNITVSAGETAALARVANGVDQVRALLSAHADKVPKRVVTDLGLSQIATQARNPDAETPGVVGALWGELVPELTALAGTIGELSALKPHLAAITDGVTALNAR